MGDHEYGNTFFRVFDNVPFSISLSALGASQLMIVFKKKNNNSGIIGKKEKKIKRMQKTGGFRAPELLLRWQKRCSVECPAWTFTVSSLTAPRRTRLLHRGVTASAKKLLPVAKTFYIVETFPTFMKESIRGRKSMMGPAVAATSRGCQVSV